MQFRTQIPILKSSQSLGYDSKVVSLGSCFAVNISQKLEYFKFANAVNPFGILFHPVAIERFLHFVVSEKQFTADDVFLHNELWHSFDAHSDLSRRDQSILLSDLNTKTQTAKMQLAAATHVLITLGTSWMYREKRSGTAVANCHKVPQSQFAKELLSVTEIARSIENTIALLKEVNADVQIIFTISPVRHIKDGFTENQWSKANLISALHSVLANNPGANYFPSYEIMMDELRDYRFYSEDMIHPNQTAVDYIWQRFAETWISESSLPVMQKVASIQKRRAHRSFHPESESHRQFLVQLESSVTELQQQFPHMQF